MPRPSNPPPTSDSPSDLPDFESRDSGQTVTYDDAGEPEQHGGESLPDDFQTDEVLASESEAEGDSVSTEEAAEAEEDLASIRANLTAEQRTNELLREMLSRVQQPQRTTEQPAAVVEDEEPDPEIDIREWTQWQKREDARIRASEADQQMRRDYAQRAATSEQLLKTVDAGEKWKRYAELVDLSEGSDLHGFLARNPDVYREVYFHPLPAFRLLELAEDRISLDPKRSKEAFEKNVQAEVDKRVALAVKQALAKQKPGVSAPTGTILPGTSRVPAAGGQKPPEDMTDAELKAATRRAVYGG